MSLKNSKIAKSDNMKVHFITGPGRAGSTLLVHLLNNHKNCACIEAIDFAVLSEKYRNVSKVTPELIRHIKRYYRFTKKLPLETYFEEGKSISYFELIQKIFFLKSGYDKGKANLTTLIERNHTYALMMKELVPMFPDAKFLFPVRDYRGFVLSNIQRPDVLHKMPVQYHAIAWYFYHKLILKIEVTYKDKVKILFYENLVRNKEQSMGEICSFFGVEYDENCFNYQEKIDLKDKDTNEFIRLSALSKPINTERVEAWKETFTPFQLKIIEYWCGQTGEKYGYKRNTNISFMETLYIRFISIPYYLQVYFYFKLKPFKTRLVLRAARKFVYLRFFAKKA